MWAVWRSPLGYQTWTCGCGRHSLAAGLQVCPGCGTAKGGVPGVSAPAEITAPVSAGTRPRRAPGQRRRTAKGAG